MALDLYRTGLKSVSANGSLIYTAPTGQHVVLSLTATNVWGSAMPVNCYVIMNETGSDANNTINIQKDLRIESRTSEDLIPRNKITLEQGDRLYVGCPENTAVEFYLSVVQDVV